MKLVTSVSHDDCVIAMLKEDPEFAAEYLKAAMEDVEEPGVLRIALRHIAAARGGVAKVAVAAGVPRESFNRALLSRGETRLSTLQAVTKAAGMKLTVEPLSAPRR